MPKECEKILELTIAKFRRFTSNKMLYICDLANSRLLTCDIYAKNNYINWLNQRSNLKYD